MITYLEAKKKAQEIKKVNTASEYKDFYMFGFDSGELLIGPQPVVVIKDTGECMHMNEYTTRFMSMPVDATEEQEDTDEEEDYYYYELDFETGRRI